MRAIASALVALAAVAGVAAAATPAGTVIRNQASASYTDADGRRVSVTSNLVETTVEQVAGLELENDQERRAVAGGRVVFAHRLRNTGNGEDRYALSASNLGGDSVDLTDIEVRADADGDGVADSDVPLATTPWIAAGDELGLVVTARVPSTARDGDTARMALLASSQFEPARSATNTDTVTVGTGAAIVVTKSISGASGASPSGPWTVTLSYANEGTGTAGNLVLIDALPAGMRYVPGSGRWSESAAALSDADPDDGHAGSAATLRYCAYEASCAGLPEADADADGDSSNQVTALIDFVPPGAGARLSFDVAIDAGLAAGRVLNRAEFEYDIAVATVPRSDTNVVSFEVLPSAGVVVNGSVATAIDGMGEPRSIASAAQGATIAFDNIVWNTGNRRDTFDVIVDSDGASFPPGTRWRLLRGNGASPLLDTDGNGSVDTGPVRPGEFARVTLELTLPAGFAGNNGGSGFDIAKSARSARDPSVSNGTVDHLDEIVANRVDLTNQAPAGSGGALGTGPGPEAAPVSTVTADGTGVARFDLFVRHQGSAPDRYRLAARATATGGALPDGWQVSFVDPATGQAIVDTGALGSGASRRVVAVVRVPPDAAPGVTSVYFVASSPLSGTRDVKHDAVEVAAASVLRLEPSLSAQLEPGGSFVYVHVASNDGNATVPDASLALANDRAGWSAVGYADTDDDGVFGPGDQPLVGPFALGPNASRTLFVKVSAPADAPLGQRNATRVTVSWNGDTESTSVTDLSTLARSRVAIRKEQALDRGCDGAPDPGAEFGPGRIEARPGRDCVVYRLTATNAGTESSLNVKIHDYTPAYTRYRPAASCSRSPCWLDEPDADTVGPISAETDQLLPGDSFWLQFSVSVD